MYGGSKVGSLSLDILADKLADYSPVLYKCTGEIGRIGISQLIGNMSNGKGRIL